MFHLARSAFMSSLGLGIALGLAAPPSFAEPDKQVYEKAEQYKGEALKLLERLVNIDTGTGDEQGLSQVSGIVIEELKKIGARVETYPAAAPANGNNVVATFTGSGKGKILLMAHMDTVFKHGTATAKPFYIKDSRAYGPGVMDDKGGIVAGLYALRILQQIGFKDYAQITLLLNSNEETGSAGSRALIEKVARQHDVVLNLEPGRAADGLVVWRKGSGTIKVEVTGKAAHAGVAPDSGRNAAMEAAHQILQLGQLGDREKQTTVNFTVINAGGATNVIPDHATAFGDVRVAVPEEFDRVEKDLAKVSEKKLIPDTQVTTHLTRGFPPMPANPQSEALAAKAQAIYGELGKKLTLEGSGGAADSSLSAGVGIPTLDGFGIVGGGIHTPEEYAEIDSIVPRFYLLTRMRMDLGNRK